MDSIFSFDDYKAYLAAYLEHLPARGHGFRSRIAKALGCHVAYVSQVLNKEAHFSLEQTEELNELLGHSEPESRFLILLVQYARAGSKRLETRFAKEIAAVREARKRLKNRVDIKNTLRQREQAKYYSSWRYAAVHMAVTIPEWQTRERLARRLRLSIEELDEVVEFLVSAGLVRVEGRRLVPGARRLFLGNDSPMIQPHHTNWRVRGIEALGRASPESVHFSGVFTLSRKDLAVLREGLLSCIDRSRDLVRDSHEEEMVCLNVDLFEV